MVQAHRTLSNLFEPHITEIARCLEFCHMSSGWFDHTEPTLSTSLQGKQGVQGAYALVRGGSSTSNLIEPHHYRDSKVFRVLSHEFRVVRLHRTFSIYIVTGETRCAGCLCTSSGWFKHIEPRRTFPNHIITERTQARKRARTPAPALYGSEKHRKFAKHILCARPKVL